MKQLFIRPVLEHMFERWATSVYPCNCNFIVEHEVKGKKKKNPNYYKTIYQHQFNRFFSPLYVIKAEIVFYGGGSWWLTQFNRG